MTNESHILPAGFYDALPPAAAHETRVLHNLLQLFESFGFAQVKPPLAEFEETLLGGENASLTPVTFRVMDPASHKMLGLRADMTVQVARLVAQRMVAVPRPVRVSYVGTVLRMVGSGLYKARELTQAGCEVIGEDSAAADAAGVIVALEALKMLGIKNLSVDFAIADMAPLIMDQFGTPSATRTQIFALLAKKDIAALAQVEDRSVLLLKTLLEIGTGGGTLEQAVAVVKNIQKLTLPKVLQPKLEQLLETLQRVHQASPQVQLTVDVLERGGFEYHHGVCFAFFAKGVAEELGRGGRYSLHNTQEPATGFTLAVDALLRVVPKERSAPKVYVPASIRAAESAPLRAKGYVTIHGLAEAKDAEAEAARLGCEYIFDNGTARPL